MDELPEVVAILRREAGQGCRPSELLRLLANRPGGEYSSSLVLAFRAAFKLQPRALTLIGGWSPTGGEITDTRIDAELGPLVAAMPPAPALGTPSDDTTL